MTEDAGGENEKTALRDDTSAPASAGAPACVVNRSRKKREELCGDVEKTAGGEDDKAASHDDADDPATVSYTHLTLPTKA